MDVIDTLENGPAKMAYLATQVVKKRAELRTAEHLLKIACARATITYGGKSKNAQETRAKMESDGDVIEAEVKVIEVKGEVELLEIPHDQIVKEFMSAHTLAKMDVVEKNAWRSQTISKTQNEQ